MGNEKFIALCKHAVVDYFNAHAEPTNGKRLTEEDVYIVWMVKALQNNKALVSTNVPDGQYYEVTYNGDKGEAYVDVYKKWENFVFVEFTA